MKKIKIGALALLLGGVFAFNVSVLTDNLEVKEISLDNFFSQAQAIDSEGGGDGYKNARNQYCALPAGVQGCVEQLLRKCDNNVFCIR